jgi:hypothetical protein
MGPHLMIRKKIILRGLFRIECVVVVFLIGLCPLFVIILLPNQKGDILLRVTHGHIPLALKILIIRNEFTVPAIFTCLQ